MKKYLIVLMVLFISCGPSEAEIQAQIDQAVDEALNLAEETTTTSSSTTTSSTTTTSTSTTTSTTTTTQLQTPLIVMDTCPGSVTAPNGFKVEYTVLARTSDVDLLNRKIYIDGELQQDDFYTNDELGLPKANKSESYTTTQPSTVEFTRAYKYRFVYTVTNKAGLTFSESCTITINSNTTTQTTQASTQSTKPYPPDPASSTWVRYEGTNNGSTVIDLSELSPGLKVVHVEYTGDDYFNIKSYDSNYDYLELMVSNIGSLIADVPLNFSPGTAYSLQIEGDGQYEIVIKPVSASLNFDVSSISGSHDVVIESYDLEFESKKINFQYSGDDYVSVREFTCDGGYNSLSVSNIGDYSGTYISRKGTCFIVIQADTGSWTISK